MQELTPGPDPFEIYAQGHKDRRFWRRTSMLLFVLLCLQGSVVVALAVRPVTVRMPDLTSGQMHSIQAGHQEAVTQAYARAFFMRMLRLRLGWNSSTVLNDMDEFLAHCFRPLREREDAILKAAVAMDPDKPSEKVPRWHAWLQAQERHEITWPEALDDIECRKRGKLWYCWADISVTSQHLLAPYDTSRRPVSMRMSATIGEVPFSSASLEGLVLLDLDEREAKKGEKGT